MNEYRLSLPKAIISPYATVIDLRGNKMLYDPKRRYTVEEYFDIHNKSEVLLQYDRGFIFSKYEAPYQPDQIGRAHV